MVDRDILKNHRELARQSAEAILSLAKIAERRSSTVVHQGARVPRDQLLRDCAQRLLDTRFTLAVVGEFSRGKSTLVNALLGLGQLLPTAIEPLTATVTVISYGEETKALVHFRDGRDPVPVPIEDLPKYVTGKDLDATSLETKLAERAARIRTERDAEKLALSEIEEEHSKQAQASAAAVSRVEIQCPSPFLQDGLVIVDTPGIGSVNPEHGEATRGIVHLADAVLFLINTDPVISASECSFLEFLQDHVNRFLFVVTKIDRFNEEERRASIDYTRKTIEQHGGIESPQIYPISARMYIEGVQQGDEPKVEASGFPKFLDGLDLFLIRSRGQQFVDGQVREALRHLRNLRTSVQMELKGLQMDLGEIRRQIEQTKPVLEKAAQARDETIAGLDELIGQVDRVVEGSGSIDWMRLALAIRETTFETIRTYDWNQLQHAAELIPLYVKDLLAKKLQPKLDEVTEHVNTVTNQTIEECRAILAEMNREFGAHTGGIASVEELDFSVDYDPAAFQAHLKQVGTITIGTTLSLTVGSTFFFGGVGAVVTLGNMLARKGIKLVFRKQVQEDLCTSLDGPLMELVEAVLKSIEREVETRLAELRSRIETIMDSAIRDVGETMSRLEQERQRTEFDTAHRRKELEDQEEQLRTIEENLSLIAMPDW